MGTERPSKGISAFIQDLVKKGSLVDEDSLIIKGNAIGDLTSKTTLGAIFEYIKNKLQPLFDQKISETQKGIAGGVAVLGDDGFLPTTALPPSAKNIVVYGYLGTDGKFYKEQELQTELPSESNKIYVDMTNDINVLHIWNETNYVVVSESLKLGESENTAYRGDRGTVAYEHSQANHAPANAEQNVQSDWSNNNTSSSSFIRNKPTKLPADGGNADTVSGHTVKADVPENAVFTDTTYSVATDSSPGLIEGIEKVKLRNIEENANRYEHPETHPASMITEDSEHSFCNDGEKNLWNETANAINGKAPISHASTKNEYGLGTSVEYGHTKIVNNLDASTHDAGNSLSAYQGYILNDTKLDKTNIVDSLDITESGFVMDGKACSEALQSINSKLNIYSETEEECGVWLGEKLYKKTTNIGALPNNSTKKITHNIVNIKRIVSVEGAAYNSSGTTLPLPYAAEDGLSILLFANKTEISITTKTNRADYMGYATLLYTKL